MSLLSILVVLTVSPIQAPAITTRPPAITMRAATTRGQNPEVRLRWQISEGWIPTRGFRLYRAQGNTRTLVAHVAAPADPLVEAILGPSFRGTALATLAGRTVANIPPLDFTIRRPPSRLQAFQQRKTALLEARRADNNLLTDQQRMALAPAINKSLAASLPANLPGLTQFIESDGSRIATARAQISLAALLKPEAATTLGLGTSDTGLAPGVVVSYALHGVDALGRDSMAPLAVLRDFKVGADLTPPAVTGLQFLQNDNIIALRWDRVPVAVEEALGTVSYRVERVDPGTRASKNLLPKPLMIVTLEGDAEPESFFEDGLQRPGSYVYSVTLVDGFGREGMAGNINVPAADWRRPPGTSQASARLESFQPRQQTNNAAIRAAALTRSFVTIGWLPVGAPQGLSTRYHIYRFSLDDTNAVPERLTPTPIPGTPFVIATEADLVKAADAVYGESFLDKYDEDIAVAEALVAATLPGAQDKLARARRAKARATAILRARWSISPPLWFSDSSVRPDQQYSYGVSVVYVETGLESELRKAGVVGVPDLRKPPSPTGVTGTFTMSPRQRITYKDIPSTRPRLSLPLDRMPVNLGAQGIGGTLPLNLSVQEIGGTLNLKWNAVPDLIGVSYRVRRMLLGGGVPVEVAVTPKTSFTDQLPPSRRRVYEYEVVAISRWSVEGAAAKTSIEVPATIAPSPPNLLSAGPASDGEIALRVAAPPTQEDVTALLVLRDGREAGRITNMQPVDGVITFLDRGRLPRIFHTYVVVAEARGAPPLKSEPSRALEATALRLTTAAPTNLTASATPRGIELRWRDPSGAVAYLVQRREGASGSFIPLTTKNTSTTFIDVYAQSGVQYNYQVIALDSFGNVSRPASINVTGI
jgi:hypothetical protein